MKIGFFYPEYYPVTSSASVHGFNIARRLVAKGHELLSATGDKNPECTKYNKSKLGMLELIRDADVLYVRVTDYFEHVAIWKMLRPFSLPVVWEINAPVEERYAFRDKDEHKIAALNSRRKFYARFVNTAICVSQNMQFYAQDFLKIRNSYYVPNGSDPEMFTPDDNEGRMRKSFNVLWAGNPALPQQAMHTMFDVASLMQNTDPGVKFIFISADRDYDFPQQDNIEVIKNVNYLNMPAHIKRADVCLCLYNNYDWSQWGFYNSPLKLFDYMSCAKPVIASRMGQIIEIIDEGVNGILTGDNPDEITTAIKKCRDDHTFARSLGENARGKIINQYNWDKAADKIEQVLLRTIKK